MSADHMRKITRRRGEPAMALLLLLGGWAAARAALWEPLAHVMDNASQILPRMILAKAPTNQKTPPSAAQKYPSFAWTDRRKTQPLSIISSAAEVLPKPTTQLAMLLPQNPAQPTAPRSPMAMAGAHQMLWMAAMGNLPLPDGLLRDGHIALPENAALQSAAGAQNGAPVANRMLLVPVQKPPPLSRRWSADGWLLWREGSAGAGLAAAGIPSYGASQMGAVLRYRLTRGGPLAPTAYLRGTAALNGFGNGLGNGSGEKGVALGLSLRPMKSLPLVLAIEGRVDHFATGGNYLRPAAMVVSAVNPINLPLHSRAEIYAQAGYVGGGNAGSMAATAFADGQLRVDHRIDRNGRGELRAGLGLWGGAQRGTARLDIGPTATIAISGNGSASARVAVDYRFRLAGNAAPTSGAAITLSAGF